MSASHVTGLALEPDNRAVTSAASVQDSYVGMRSLWQRGALRCCNGIRLDYNYTLLQLRHFATTTLKLRVGNARGILIILIRD